jgi:2-methylaconitate cis-trans-isomerase PrpF
VHEVAVEHPQGKMFVRVEIVDQDGVVSVKQASQIRNARKLFEGNVFVPASVWSGV